jgi:EAL domain-containing protein (putative c-di-GMP-specific phosphodiesterase class I)
MPPAATTLARTAEARTIPRRRVLIVDDDEALSRVFAGALSSSFVVSCARDGREAARLLEGQSFDVIVTDISMPEMTGIELLQLVRRHDLDVPVVLVTGSPDVQSAARAVEHGAFRYLEKPVPTRQLQEVVARAAQIHELARIKRRALALLSDRASEASDRAGLTSAFTDVLDTLFMHFQPIVRSSTRSVLAYEALVRSPSPVLPSPAALLDAAERLGRMNELGRAIRGRVARIMPTVPEDQLVFVNLHSLELSDEELISPEAPLSAHASRVVLEVTERATLDDIADLDGRIDALRGLGYRLAVDDLGAGYAGLTNVVRLNPEFVKIDMSLIRDLHRSETKRVLVRSTLDLCREMSMQAVVEGVETRDELRALSDLGAELLQGYLFGKPRESLLAVDAEAFAL